MTSWFPTLKRSFEALELPYRVVYVCTGDLGQGQLRKHDLETWMPSRESYGETHSCSSFHDFQSRRLNLRYKEQDGKKRFCHTLNNTAVASPRILIPLLECHQLADGSIKIPASVAALYGWSSDYRKALGWPQVNPTCLLVIGCCLSC